MRLVTVSIGAIAAVLAAPAFAQDYTPTGWDYVRYTIRKYLSDELQFYPGGDAPNNPYETEMWKRAVDACGATTLWQAVKCTAPDGTKILAGEGGSFGGGGATGTWDSCDFTYTLDAEGNLIVPSMPFPGSGSIQIGGTWWAIYPPDDYYQGGDTFQSTALWATHRYNLRYRGNYVDKRGWVGVLGVSAYYETSKKYILRMRSTAFYDNSTLVPALEVTDPEYEYIHGPSTWKDSAYSYAVNCPQGGASGGDFNFYVEKHNGNPTVGKLTSVCIEYAPNNAVSPSGYYYAPQTTVPASEIDNFPSGTWLDTDDCRIDKDAIRKLVDWAAKQAYPGAPSVKKDQVSGEPSAKTLKDAPPGHDYEPGPEPTPSPTPSPSPTDSTGGNEPSGWFDAPPSTSPTELNEPSLPGLPDWFPDLPSFTLATNATCPTYGGEVFGHQYVLDIHCPLIEGNRSTISALMIVFFTLGALIVVLRS